MHVLMFTGKTLPGALEESLHIFQEEAMEIIGGAEHFCGVRVLTRRDGTYTLEICALAECGPGVLRELHQVVIDKFADVFEEEPEFSVWQLRMQDEMEAVPLELPDAPED